MDWGNITWVAKGRMGLKGYLSYRSGLLLHIVTAGKGSLSLYVTSTLTFFG